MGLHEELLKQPSQFQRRPFCPIAHYRRHSVALAVEPPELDLRRVPARGTLATAQAALARKAALARPADGANLPVLAVVARSRARVVALGDVPGVAARHH